MTSHLIDEAEIRQRLGGISHQRFYQLTTRPDWAKPYQGNVWRREDVEAWVARNRRPEFDQPE